MKFEGYIVRYRHPKWPEGQYHYNTSKSGSLPQIYTESGAKAACTQFMNKFNRWKSDNSDWYQVEMIAVVVNPCIVDVETQHTDLTSQ